MTFRELAEMYDAKVRDQWEHTSHMLWIIANVNSADNKKIPVSSFNPTIDEPEPMTIEPEDMRAIFVPNDTRERSGSYEAYKARKRKEREQQKGE